MVFMDGVYTLFICLIDPILFFVLFFGGFLLLF